MLSRIFWTIILLPFSLIPLFFFGAGVRTVWLQDHKIDTYRPAPAEIISVAVASRVGSGRNHDRTYFPKISYRYDVAGRQYQSDVVLPTSESKGESWARSITDQYHPGQSTSAYYDPANPANCFLVRRYSFLGPFFVLFSMPFLILFTGGIGYAIVHRWEMPLPTESAGQFHLAPKSTFNWKTPLMIAVAWHGVGIVIAVDYFSRARQPDALALIATPVYFAIGILPLRMLRKGRRLSQRMGMPIVHLPAPVLRLGGDFPLGVEMEFFDASPRSVDAGLICETATGTGKGRYKRILSEEHQPCGFVAESRAGRFTGQVTFTVPGDAPASSTGLNPQYTWRIVVHTRFKDGLDYAADFPVKVEPAGAGG